MPPLSYGGETDHSPAGHDAVLVSPGPLRAGAARLNLSPQRASLYKDNDNV